MRAHDADTVPAESRWRTQLSMAAIPDWTAPAHSETVFRDGVLRPCSATVFSNSARRIDRHPGGAVGIPADSADWRPMARNPLQRGNP